jgi:PAS domain S-box-containing protein
MAVSFFAIWGAINGIGPFVSETPEVNALSVQLFMIVAAVTLLFLAAVTSERDETAQRNRAMLRANPDLVFVMSRDGVYLDYHARSQSELFLLPEMFMGKNVRDVLPPELADHVNKCLEKTASTNEPQVLEYSLNMNGEESHYEARLIAMEGDKCLSIVRNVTDRQKAALALRESQEKLHHSHTQIRSLLGRLIDVQEAERRRISRELHDDLNQKIATLSIGISRLKRRVPLPDEQLIEELDELREHTNRLANEIRRLSHQLHPAVLEHLGLVTALESYIGGFKDEEQIDVNLKAELGEERVPFQASICIYRVAVEALRNVSRHSGATSAEISLKRVNGSLELKVSDSGKGFDVEKFRKEGGLGLVSIEERLRLLRGTCEIDSSPQKGTTLVARVPLTN